MKMIKDNNLEITEELWKALLLRDDFACLKCGSEENLQPAHFISRRYKDTALELSNLMLLCSDCHRGTHDGKIEVAKFGEKFFFRDNPTKRKRNKRNG